MGMEMCLFVGIVYSYKVIHENNTLFPKTGNITCGCKRNVTVKLFSES
jgi:hypothetical protein